MSVNFVRIGLLLFSILGFGVGFAMIFTGFDPSRLCGKSCQLISAMIDVFGKDTARFLVASVWITGGVWFGYMAIRLKKR